MDEDVCTHGLDDQRICSKSGCSGSWHLAIANKNKCMECGRKTKFITLEQWEKEALPIII